MRIESVEKRPSFKAAVWSAMDSMGIGETVEVPFSQLGYLNSLVHDRNKENKGKFSVMTVPVMESGILCGVKTVYIVRKK